MKIADALRRVALIARALLAISLLAAPGVLTDDASTVPLFPDSPGATP